MAAKNNLLLRSVLGVFPKTRFNTYGTKDVILFLFSKEVQYIIFFPKEIKNLLFFPTRSSISSFFQGGPVYHVFSQRRSSAPSFSKEVQHIMLFSKKVTYISFFPKEIKYFFFFPKKVQYITCFLQGDPTSPCLNPRRHIVTNIHQASGFWAQNQLTIQRCFQKGKQILAMFLKKRD